MIVKILLRQPYFINKHNVNTIYLLVLRGYRICKQYFVVADCVTKSCKQDASTIKHKIRWCSLANKHCLSV